MNQQDRAEVWELARATGRQANMSLISLELRSEITPAGQLRLSLEEREVACRA